MALDIKNEEAHLLAQRLARLTGESMTEAVTEALRERLERLGREREVPLADRLLAIGRDCAAHLKNPMPRRRMVICSMMKPGSRDDRGRLGPHRHPSQ